MKEIKIYEIPNIDFVERIDDPYIGMIFYVSDIDAYYSVKTLKEINGINMKGSKVVEYVIDDYADFGTGSGGGSGLTATQLSNIAKIPAIKATVDALPNNYASKNHNHSEYASSSHRHDASEIDNLPSGSGTGLTDEEKQNLAEIPTIKTKVEQLAFHAANAFQGKIANFLGDSQTEVNSHKSKIYHDWVKEILGLSKVNNYGISGTTIAKKNTSDNTAMCVRYANMDSNADLICVMGGVNDRWFNCQLGNFGDTNPSTFYGAMETLCDGLLTKYPGKTIIFITPTEQNHNGCNSANTTGYTPTDFANAMKKVCAKYSIPVFDANTCLGIYPLNEANASLYTTDKLHLNNKGHELLGNKLSKFILNGANVVMINNESTGGSSGGSTGGSTPETPGETPGETPTENQFIGKTVTVTKNFTTNNNSSNFAHLTALLNVDDDMRSESTYNIVLRASNASNMSNASNTGGSLFDDNSGEVSNGSLDNSNNTSVSSYTTFTQTVSNGNLTITAGSRNGTVTTNYVKVPIIISGSIPYSFQIDEIKVVVNDVERNILKLGAFFSNDIETITID